MADFGRRERALAAIALLSSSLAACGTTSTAPPGDASVDAPVGCPASGPCCNCTEGGGGTCECIGSDASIPGCAANAASGLACEADSGDCMGCFQSSTLSCGCGPGEGGEGGWTLECIPTEKACTGGTF
ncbi:MAG TPA: hypothetical protein VGL81_11445 [Polyangiaceae bacterium]|jgi:hypothetical protein